jgi:tetratricopeptide (TPR) repeat protein
MPCLALFRVALPAAFALACAPGDVVLPEPPRPGLMESFAPAAVEHIEGALAKLEAEPRSDRLWAELGMVYNAERQRRLAAECFEVAARLAPRDPKWPYHRANVLARVGSQDEAIVAMERSIELEPEYAPSHARLGNLRFGQGDMQQAEAAFRTATRLDSSYPGGWIGLARVAIQLDDDQQAIEILERLSREDPEDRTFQQMLAMARRESGMVEGLSVEHVLGEQGGLAVWNDPWELESRAFQRLPGMLQVIPLMGQGKYAEVVRLIEEERANGVSSEETAFMYARALLGLERRPEALVEVERYLAAKPESTEALLMRARLLDDLGDVEGAVAVFEQLCLLLPESGGMFAATGLKQAQLGRHASAVESLRTALELDTGDFELRSKLAASLYALKRWGEARTVLAGLLEERPEHGDTWVRYATVCARSNRLKEAERALQRAAGLGASPQAIADVREKIDLIRRRRAQAND